MRIKTLLITLIFIVGCNSQNNQWVDLFDGTSMNGWHVYNSDNTGKQWSAKDGQLVFKNKLLVTNEDLVTDKEYTNFELCFRLKLIIVIAFLRYWFPKQI